MLGVRVSTATFMEGTDEDNLKEFTCGIFTNLVRIQDTQGPAVASSSPLSNRPEIFYLLLLIQLRIIYMYYFTNISLHHRTEESRIAAVPTVACA